jgi:flagellar biosynthesis protein FlhB
MSQEAHEPVPPRYFALILVVVLVAIVGYDALWAFLVDFINQYLPPEMKLSQAASLRSFVWSFAFAIAVIFPLAVFCIIYALWYETYRSWLRKQ